MNELSIIIPVYNGEKYIGTLMDDLLKIDNNRCEIIVVNDGSVDRTREIIQQYSEKYNSIKLINQENAGPSKARNYGVSIATGKYIAFCDADDRIDAAKFAEFYSESIASEAEYCFTGYIEQNFKTDKEKMINAKGEGTYNLEQFMDVFFTNLTINLISYPINKIFLKSIIDENNIKFDENVHYAEDLLFNLDYLQHVNSIHVSKVNYYVYQRYTNENSLSNNFNMGFWDSRKFVYKKLKQFCSRIESNKKYEIQINTYAINTMLYTITQIMDTETSSINKISSIKKVICDKHLLNFINGEANANNKQKLLLRAVKTKNPLIVYLLSKGNNLRWKIRNLIK